MQTHLATVLAAAVALAAPTPPAEAKGSAERFIFVFKDTVPAAEVAARAEALTRRGGGDLSYVYQHAIRGFTAVMPLDEAERLAARSPRIASVERDAGLAIANDGAGTNNLEQPSPCPSLDGCDEPQILPWGVERVGGPVQAKGETVWILDTGVDLDHPDLRVNTVLSRSFVADPSPDDAIGKGTQIAGVAAAIDNSIGVVGVAAGASVVSVRVLDANGTGSYSGLIAGIDYVAANAFPGDVATLALGGPFNSAVETALRNAAALGIAFVFPAGNSGSTNIAFPASLDGLNFWTVAAIDQMDLLASFSNFGLPPVDCADPGVRVRTTNAGGGFTTLSGTQMSAAHLAGVLTVSATLAVGGTVIDPLGNAIPICVIP